MSNQCPSNLALDAFRLGFDPSVSDHVKGCPRCEAWLRAQQGLEAKVASFWTAGAPEPRRETKRFLRYLFGLGIPATLAAAVLLLLGIPKKPSETAKGDSAPVQIARLSAGTLSWLSPQDDLLPNDSIRFFVHRADEDDRYVLVGSLDGTRQLARFYPADANGCSMPLPAAGEALDGSIIIDGAPGPERIVVVVSHRPLCWPAVAESLTSFGLGGPPAGELLAADVHVSRLVFAKPSGADR